jgi:hypothetical protein
MAQVAFVMMVARLKDFDNPDHSGQEAQGLKKSVHLLMLKFRGVPRSERREKGRQETAQLATAARAAL